MNYKSILLTGVSILFCSVQMYGQNGTVTGFMDDFSTHDHLSSWAVRTYNNSGIGSNYTITHDATEENLQVVKNTSKNDYIVFTFENELDLGVVNPYIRFRVKSAETISRFQAKLRDADAPDLDGNFNTATGWNTMEVPGDGQYYEAIWEYSEILQDVDPGRIKEVVMGIDRVENWELSDVRLDDFRVGIDAYPNQKPVLNPVKNPGWSYLADGEQLIEISGIGDGNAEREENITIMVTSGNLEVVPDENIVVNYDGFSSSASIGYTPASKGIAVLTITLQDDRGTVYSDEQDTESVDVIVEVRDATPGVNDMASFGTPQVTHVNVGADHQNIAILPNVDDGDEDMEQEIIFDYVNNSEELLIIDSISWTIGKKFALIYFRDRGVTGNASVTVSCIDEEDFASGNDPFELTFDIPLGTYDTYGAFYGATQIAQWQPQPYKQDPVFKDGYPIIFEEAFVDDHSKDNLFWGKMWGYIIPPVDGAYKFYSTTEGEGIGNFYLSSDDTREGMPAEDSPTARTGQASALIELQAGKPYYFEAMHKEIINDYFLRLEWIYPGISEKQTIAKPYLFSLVDSERPTAPRNLRLVKRGTNLVLVEWEESTDNSGVEGYRLYVNGELYNTELINETSLLIEGLDPDSRYDIFVLAVDKLSNFSGIWNVLSLTTFGEDFNPPEAPVNLVSTEKTAFTVTLEWDESTDNETEVFGYNLYMTGSDTPVNKDLIVGTSYKVPSLDEVSEYSFIVTALDAALNESGPSNIINVTTNEFTWDDKDEDAKIGLVELTLEPTVPATGFAIEGNYHLSSIFLSNKVSYNSFEDPAYKDNATDADLEKVDKFKSAGLLYFVENDAYHGEKAARLDVGPGERFTAVSSIVMSPSYNYILRVSARKNSMYDGSVGVRIFRDVGGNVNAFNGSFTPTEEWAVYELEFQGIQDAIEQWKIEFTFNSLGYVYMDDLQFHVKEWYDPNSKFTTVGMDILNELQPAAVRWGAIDANYESFAESVGPYQKKSMTLGDFAELSSIYGGYALLTVGVNSTTDWIKEAETFASFMEYLSGPEGSTWGAVRASEGYATPFDEKLEGIVIEMGNEVWGYDSHGADAFEDNYSNYAKWAADMAENQIRASNYYNADKMYVSFSGRSPDNNYGLHDAIFNFENSMMDMLSISGYLGGNLNYDPGVDPGDSQLDYHKNSYQNFYQKINGLHFIFKDMLEELGRIEPMYMYEGNLTKNEYHGTVGQAVTFADYYAEVMENGVALPDVFTLEGGQWRLLDDKISLNKRPLYHIVQHYNNACKGVVLKSSYHSVDSIYNDNGRIVNLESLGVHSYANGNLYSMALFSRDFENDYVIKVDLPDDIGTISNGKMVIIGGENFNSLNASVETSDIEVTDGMLVEVPKYTAVIISFNADDKNLVPAGELGEYMYQKVEELILDTDDGIKLIDKPLGRKKLIWTALPEDAFYTNVEFEIIENTANATLSSSAYVRADGATNGYITIKGTAMDLSGVTDEITIEITGQNVGIEDKGIEGINMYPNPASDLLNIELVEKLPFRLRITNVQGAVVKDMNVDNNQVRVNIEDLRQGVYFVHVIIDDRTEVLRFVKK